MASVLLVDKLDPQSGTALELGTSGDTVTVPSGVGLTLTDSTLLLPTTITSTTEVKPNKVSPATGVAFALGDSGDTFTVPSGATIVNSGTATGFGITATSFRPNVNPLIINGDMAVIQRAQTVTGITSDSFNTCDRWYVRATNGGTWTQTQEALTADEAYEDGFSKALKMDCTTADASLGAGDYIRMLQRIEAQDLQLLKFGSSTSATLTLGFWVKATKTGTYIVELYQPDDDRSCSKSYTIDATDTWEFKVLNYPADTTGVIDNDNDTGLTVTFWMGAGTDYTSGTLNETWNSTVAANRAVGQVNAADSTSNNFHITGVQLEVGEYTSADLPPFQHESYGDNLMRCFRYYFKMTRDTTNQAVGMGRYWSTTSGGGMFNFPVPMRGAVTMDFVNGTSYFTASVQGENDYFDGCTQNDYGPTTSGWYMSGGGGVTTATGFICMTNNSLAVCAWKSEL